MERLKISIFVSTKHEFRALCDGLKDKGFKLSPLPPFAYFVVCDIRSKRISFVENTSTWERQFKNDNLNIIMDFEKESEQILSVLRTRKRLLDFGSIKRFVCDCMKRTELLNESYC